MKNLELKQMEGIEGGTTNPNRDCLLRGVGLGYAAAFQIWAVVIVLASTSSHCYEF